MLTLNPEYEKFDIRTCPIWVIPQLAELKRRLSKNGEQAKFIQFDLLGTDLDGPPTGRFVIYLPGEGTYYGYLFVEDMNRYRHPQLWILQ